MLHPCQCPSLCLQRDFCLCVSSVIVGRMRPLRMGFQHPKDWLWDKWQNMVPDSFQPRSRFALCSIRPKLLPEFGYPEQMPSFSQHQEGHEVLSVSAFPGMITRPPPCGPGSSCSHGTSSSPVLSCDKADCEIQPFNSRDFHRSLRLVLTKSRWERRSLRGRKPELFLKLFTER